MEYCILIANRFYGLRASDIRTLAFQLKNKITNQFVIDTGSAGRMWLRLFLKRNSSISPKTPQRTSAQRAKEFTQSANQRFL